MPNSAAASDHNTPDQNTPDQGLIPREELRARLARGDNFHLLEALGELHYHRGHLPGAVLFPHDKVRQLAPLVLPDASQSIVVYCASSTCRNSQVAAGVLRQLGYQDVRVYAGGKQDWEAAGLPLER
jgi:rhodanese-related sulfurtransferase